MQNSFAHDIHNGTNAMASKEEIKAMSDKLAGAAHLTQPLPAGRDIPMRYEDSLMNQLDAIHAIESKPVVDAVWSRFCVDHLRTLVKIFLTLDRHRQRRTCHLFLLVLCGINPLNPYFLRFLRTPSLTRSLPKAVVELFVHDTFLQDPGMANGIAELLPTFIFECEDAEQGDEKACIGAKLRATLLDKMMEIQAKALGKAGPLIKWGFVLCLVQELASVEQIPGFVRLTRALVRKQEAMCASVDCRDRSQPAFMACSGCRTVVYCSQACQKTDWTKGHRMQCFQVQY